MPPVYSWKCDACGQEMEVVRSVAEYEKAPDAEDGGTGLLCDGVSERSGAPMHMWRRFIPQGSGNFQLLGRSWARDKYR